MKTKLISLAASLLSISSLAACGGGGGGSPAPAPVPTPAPPPAATLTSIAISPLAAFATEGGLIQLQVNGSYSDGTMRALPPSGETFMSSNASAATVSAAGLVAIPATAIAGSTSTISARDVATGLVTSPAASSLITVSAAGGPPRPSSASAANSTALANADCTAIQPFYWEIGDQGGALASGSSSATGQTPVLSSTPMSIASASKWIYGMYVLQKRGGVANLTSADIAFLNFTSGYSYMGSDTQSATCTAPSSGADSINYCLTLPSQTPGKLFSSQNPATIGVFDYDGGHEENHAGQLQPEINDLDTSALGAAIAAQLGISGVTLRYNQPLLAGGIYGTADDYTPLLRGVLSGQLEMLGALGKNPVCAWTGTSACNAASSPIVTVHWHYSMAHWVEDDPTSGDGAFSSPGAFGFYPWIEANKNYYGVIARAAPTGMGTQNGLASAQCGHALRAAWESGTQQ
jgi:hypothetical protein